MSEKFKLIQIDDYVFQIHDIDNDLYLVAEQICSLLNGQQTTINQLKEDNEQLRKYNGQLKERLERINGGYGHLTYRRGLTANEWLIESQERELKKKNEQISDLKEENERLKQQLLYDGDDVCGICKHEYLVPSGDYFIGKCKKGHKECSKEDIKYCEDFELIQADLEDLIKRMDKELIVND